MAAEPRDPPELAFDDVKERLLRALDGLRFGAVELQIHDFRVVRITRTEQVRVENSAGGKRGP